MHRIKDKRQGLQKPNKSEIVDSDNAFPILPTATSHSILLERIQQSANQQKQKY
jgi:hypothetical protein